MPPRAATILRPTLAAILSALPAAALALAASTVLQNALHARPPYGPTIRGDSYIIDSNARRRLADSAEPGAIGRIQYTLKVQSEGRPETTRKTAQLDLTHIDPLAGAPPASDTAFWRTALGDALEPTPTANLLPPGFLACGQMSQTQTYARAYLTNGLAALKRPIPAILAATWCLLIAAIAAVRSYTRLARSPHACPACGYDLRGHTHTTCPECGAPVSAPARA